MPLDTCSSSVPIRFAMMLLMVSAALFVTGCGSSSDGGNDDGSDDGDGDGGDTSSMALVDEVLLSEVSGTLGFVEITNTSSETRDISGYWLCVGPPHYQRLSDMDLKDGAGDLSALPADASIIVSPTNDAVAEGIAKSAGSLGLYHTGGDFANPATMSDFVQWGSGGHPREDVASAAGIWAAGSSLDDNASQPEDFEISLTRTTFAAGVDNWSLTDRNFAGTSNDATVILTEISPLFDTISIFNRSDSETMDLSDVWVCSGGSRYEAVATMTLADGSDTPTAVPPGGKVVVTPSNAALKAVLDADSGSLSIYDRPAAFTNPAAMLDFVQWDGAGKVRSDVAAAADIWTPGTYVSGYPDPAGSGKSLIRRNGGTGTTAWTVGVESTIIEYQLSTSN